MSNPVEVHFGEYKTLVGSTRHGTAENALIWLQKQYEQTSPGVLGEFARQWRQGVSSGQPISFIDVAKYYDPAKHPHQRDAINYLNSNLNENTRKRFDDIWFGRVTPPKI
jgi:hypothetical protein